MPVVDPYLDALETLKGKPKPAGKNALLEGAKGFAVGAGKALVSPFTEAARVAGEMFPEAPAAMGITPPRSRIAPVPSHAPAGTVSYEQQPPAPTTGGELAGEAALGLASWIPVPSPVGPIFPVQIGRSLMEGAQAGAPVEGPTGPMPPPPSIVGERLGGAAVGAGFGAPGLVGAGLGRFRSTGPALRQAPTEPPRAVPADYEIVGQGPQGLLPEGPGGGAAAAPAAAPAPRPGLGSGLPPERAMLPQGHRGLTAEKVEPGFTPIRSTYRVWIGAKPSPTGPGGKAAKPEFRQYKDFTAFSREDAISKAQDALGGARARVLEFKADEVKGSGQALSGAEQRGEPSATPRERHMEKAVGAVRRKLARDEAIQEAKPKAGQPEKPIALPATSAELTAPPKTAKPGKAVAPKETETPVFPLRAKPEPKEPPPSAVEAVAAAEEKPIGGKSKVIREPTAQETLEMKPGEMRVVSEHERVVKPTAETERRLLERRGAGGGATSFGEERGPEVVERRVAAPRGRRTEDRAELGEAAREGRRQLVEIRNAKSHSELVALYRKYQRGEPKPGISTKELREELTREAASLVKGASQAGKNVPKVGAAAQAAKPEQQGRSASVKTPSKEFPVRYEEVSISELRPSNNPATFEPHREYPFEQQRDYRTNKIEQDKVIRMAKRFNPDYILADTPTSTDGPPIVSREGYVIGGNARTMALMRGLEEGTISPEALRSAVEQAGQKFGIQKAGTQTGTIIVRRMTEEASLEQLAKDTKAVNEDFKMAVDPVSDAVARARNLSPDTVDWISGALQDAGPDATVRAAIFDDPARLTQLVGKLAEDQVVVSSELPRLLDPSTNKLTPEGTRMIESALIGRVIRSPKMIREMSPALKNVVLGAISPLIRGETFPAEWRVNNDVVNGLWLHHMAEKAGKTIDMMLEPQIIPEAFLDAVKGNRVALAMARWFEANRSKSTSLRTALNRYNAHAAESVSGQELLGFLDPAKTPHEAMNDAFGLRLTPDDFGTGDGLVYMHAGLPLEALAPMWKKASEKARQLKDWIFIPKDVREPWKPGEPFDQWWKRGAIPRTGDSFRIQLRQTWEKFAKAAILNAETRRYPYFHEQIDQYRVEAMAAMEKATNMTAEVIHPIVYGRHAVTGVFKRKPDADIARGADQLNYLIGVADLWGRSKEGKLTPANGFPDWAAFPKEEVTRLLDAELKSAMLRASPSVRLAHQNWIKMMTFLGNELEKRGALREGGKRDWTYAPNIVDSYDWGQMREVSFLNRKVGEPARGYVKRALGHLRKHDPNMIRAGLKHTYSVLMDNVTSDFAHSVGRDWDYSPKIWEQVEAMAKKQGRTVEAVAKEIKVPDGHVAFRVGLTRRFWEPTTDVEFALQRAIIEDPDFGIRFENLWQIREYAGLPGLGKARSVYIIPEAIAARLQQFREARSPLSQLEFQLGKGMAGWKALTLTSVYASYRLTNILGDMANVVIRTPGTVPFLPGLEILAKNTPRALKEIVRAYTKGETSESLQRTEAVGGRQNVRAIAELGDLRAHKDLRPFFEPQRAGVLKPASKLLQLANDAMGNFLILDAILEGTLRHATVDYLSRKGFPLKRAERFASEIIGDYRNTDPFTARMRRNGVFPFMVWIRQMVPGWIRWFTGAKLGKYFEGPGGEAIAPPNVKRPPVEPPKGTDPVLWKMVHSGRFPTGSLAAWTLGVGLPMALLYYWNSVLNEDLDKKVPEFIRRGRTYLIMPDWVTPDGRPIVWMVQTPIDAVTGFFGMGNLPDRVTAMKKAVDAGPKATAKAVFDQMTESVGATASGIGDLAGPPADVLMAFVKTGADVRNEIRKPGEKRDVPKVVRRNIKKLFGEVVPFGRLASQEPRQDLEGVSPWVTAQVRGTPWGTLVYIQISDAERRRLRAKNREPSKTLRPMGGSLQPISP